MLQMGNLSMERKTTESFYTLKFGLLCLSSLLFFSSFNLIVPELFDHLTSLGGAEYKGWIIALFTLTAGFSRPFSGKLTDTIGRVPIMIVGTLVSALAGVLYIFVGTVMAFFALRMFHGFSTGFKPTGTSAYVADIVPSHRRGEAMGIMSLAGTLGMAFGPKLGGFLANNYGLNVMYIASSCLALLSILILAGMKESHPNPKKFELSDLKINKSDLVEKSVLPTSLVMFLCLLSFGTVLTLIPDFSAHLGLENKGDFFFVFALSSVLTRFLGGKASDIFGRHVVVLISTLLLGVALLAIGFSTTKTMLLWSGGLFGLAVGMNSPALMAWAVDRSPKEKIGRALSTMYIALETGIGLGSLISASLYGNDASNFPKAFGFASVGCLTAFLLLLFQKKTARS